ncbi:MAG: GumC family protein [Rhodothalassiaceae bacterium]
MTDLARSPLDDLADLAATLRDRLLTVVAVAGLGTLLVAAMVMRLPDAYAGVALLLVDARESRVSALQGPVEVISDEDRALLSEMEIIRSREVAETVIRALDLVAHPDFNPALAPERPAGPVERWIAPLLTPLKHWLAGPDRGPVPILVDDPEAIPAPVYRAFAQALSTRIRGGSRVIEIRFTARDPQLAAAAANAVLDTYTTKRFASDLELADEAADWLTGRIDTVLDEISGIEAAIAERRAVTGQLRGDDNSLLVQQVEALTSRLTEMSAEHGALLALNTQVTAALKADREKDLIYFVDTDKMAQLEQELSRGRAELSRIEATYGTRHPTAQAARAQLDEVADQIQREARRYADRLQQDLSIGAQQEESLREEIAGLRQEMRAGARDSAALQALERDAETKRALLNSLLEQQAVLAKVEDRRAVPTSLKIISRADVPTQASGPRRGLLLVLGLAASLAAGLIAALLRDWLSGRVSRLSQLKWLPEHAPFSGHLPKPPGRRKLPTERAFHALKRSDAYGEAVRVLLSQVRRPVAFGGMTGQVVAVVSGRAGEGKSTTAAALAIKAAQTGLSTLLLDCDGGRRGRGAPPSTLVDLIHNRLAIDEAVHRSDTLPFAQLGIETLDGDTRDALASEAMDQLLLDLRNAFDLVVVDCPPVTAFAHSARIAGSSDLALFLMRWRRAGVRDVLAGVRLLLEAGVKVRTVLTGASARAARRFGIAGAERYKPGYDQWEPSKVERLHG